LLFCSHDTGAVLNLCTKAILMKQGEILLSGDPKDVINEYLFDLRASKSPDIQYRRSIETTSQDKEYVPPCIEFFDQRDAIFNGCSLRNDIEVIRLNDDNNFGTGVAKVESVYLKDENNNPLAWAVGGQNLIIEINCRAFEEISQPIIGFQIKDRLGQVLFCDNTYISYMGKGLHALKGSLITAAFKFRLPYLRAGDYSISPAIASGDQESHIQHHWVHDALILKVQNSSVIDGLIGLGMQDIQLNISQGN